MKLSFDHLEPHWMSFVQTRAYDRPAILRSLSDKSVAVHISHEKSGNKEFSVRIGYSSDDDSRYYVSGGAYVSQCRVTPASLNLSLEGGTLNLKGIDEIDAVVKFKLSDFTRFTDLLTDIFRDQPKKLIIQN